jgi:hypothetical protein
MPDFAALQRLIIRQKYRTPLPIGDVNAAARIAQGALCSI